MSYVVHIWQSPVPRDVRHAEEIIDQLSEEQERSPRPAPAALVELLKRLTARYPDITTLSDDEYDQGVWTDGPMRATRPIYVLGIRRQWVDEVQPFVVREANALGLVCYDMQRGKVYLPTTQPDPEPAGKEGTLLAAIHADPSDRLAYRALADCLEEQGQTGRAELLRLDLALRELAWDDPTRRETETRLQRLLAEGVKPCLPTLTNGIGMEFALIPAGRFRMGTPPGELPTVEDYQPRPDEWPVHPVEISRPFYLGIFPVTQAQYQQVIGHNPSSCSPLGNMKQSVGRMDTGRFPVEGVSWDDAMEFCKKLGELPVERKAKRSYRLPSEAEWEYACRAGTTTAYHFGATVSLRQVNFSGHQRHRYEKVEEEGPRRTAAVDGYRPNAWGLFSMHGNVCEWCADWWEAGRELPGPLTDPVGPKYGALGRRVLRGGSYASFAWECRAASRRDDPPGSRGWGGTHGFRVVCLIGSPAPQRSKRRGQR